jgi:hypothetical protein
MYVIIYFICMFISEIAYSLPAITKVTIQCGITTNTKVWKCKCSEQDVGITVENLDGTLLICNKNKKLELINVRSFVHFHLGSSNSLKATPGSRNKNSTAVRQHNIPKDKHIEKKMKHIVERPKDILDNIDEKEKEEKWKLLLMKFKHGNNAREIILQSKNCNVFGYSLSPGETLNRLGCTYVCDDGDFKKRACGKNVHLTLYGTHGKYL